MPPFDEAALKDHIAAARIGALSIDTSVFDKLGRNLNTQPLAGLAQFRHGPTRFVLSGVVVGELKAHLCNHANQAKQELAAKLRGIGTHWHRTVDNPAVEAVLGIARSPEEYADAFFAEFVDTTAPVIVGVETVDLTQLLGWYFAADPPFGDKDTKKHEFPDAMALASLAAWARDAKTIMLVISGDTGWRDYCDKSDHLICMLELPAALNLFNENASVLVSRVLAKLDADQAEDLQKAIGVALESFLEELDVEIEADSSVEYEVDYVEPSLNGWRIYDPSQADVISVDDDLLVFSVPVHANVSFGVAFRFHHWDSVDREYVRLRSRTEWIPRKIEVIMTISISKELEPAPDVYEISTMRDRIELEIGNVEPDYR
jgi:hypothetical protein